MAKAAKGDEREEALGTTQAPSTRKSICNLFTRARDWTRDLILGPPTSLDDCMNVFFDTCDLQNENKYFCESCNRFGWTHLCVCVCVCVCVCTFARMPLSPVPCWTVRSLQLPEWSESDMHCAAPRGAVHSLEAIPL